ncbi:YpmS family protein [Heyndrickxia acidicola]|uniref:YpmS family protein n=1 Tax=Heyndrickxia acidicola TaxID=209389 RepID=A0ABU6ML07_9BACI|nr:YpmS family protein [Heyndrickxia acidicola]MED1205376.1 YpmS family protein [Heyndrickxia acidicola]
MTIKNGWKRAFFVLVIVELCVAAGLIGFVLFPSSQKSIPKLPTNNGEYVPFHVHTNKEDLNQVIAHYLKQKGQKGPVHYNVVLNHDVELYGTVHVFTENIQLKMTFEPKSLRNGDLILKEKSLSFGNMNLPASYILKFVSSSYDLPDWVSVNPNAESIYVALTRMKLSNNARVKVDEFNLNDDKIAFTLLFPGK